MNVNCLKMQKILIKKDFSADVQLFSADVYNEISASSDSNFLFSPFSLETILALTQSGAKDTTREEIITTLHLPNPEETATIFKNILPLLQNNNYTLHTANKIFIEENYAIREEFTNVAVEVYDAGVENIEFLQNVEAANTINQWVEEETDAKIRDLILPEDIDANTRLILINALYFEGTWLNPFEALYTATKSFFISGEESQDVDMMFQYSIKHRFYESEELDAKFLELPFAGDDASMTFVLPNSKDGLLKLENQRHMIFQNIPYDNLKDVLVALPKFRIETSVDFNEILQNLGIRGAFDPAVADFSGIAGEKGELYVQKVKQKTFISVDESGVEAAAASSVDVPIFAAETNQFVADHPFMFFIRVKGVVLFEGRVLVPEV